MMIKEPKSFCEKCKMEFTLSESYAKPIVAAYNFEFAPERMIVRRCDCKGVFKFWYDSNGEVYEDQDYFNNIIEDIDNDKQQKQQ